MVKGLLDANVISEVKYTKWLSNMVIVRTASRKKRMCVDYIDLDRVCLNDSYSSPNIDKLVDS